MGNYNTQPYLDALGKLRIQINYLHKLMNDPFQAPEVSVFEIPSLLNILWKVQVEYAAMIRYKERVDV